MLENYFKIAWRNIWRNKIFSAIKIAGLSIGLTVCMLIMLYTKDEVSFDQFHKNKASIYRVVQTMQFGQDRTDRIGITQAPLGVAFAKEIPEIRSFVRVNQLPVTIKKGADVFTENPLFVDSNYLDVFSFPLSKGNPATALRDIHSIVLSKDAVKKYFPQDAEHGYSDAIGKTMQLKMFDEFENFTVTGIAENVPENSTLKFEMLLPLAYYTRSNNYNGWIGGTLNTFLVLSPTAKIKIVEQKMQQLFDKNTKEQV